MRTGGGRLLAGSAAFAALVGAGATLLSGAATARTPQVDLAPIQGSYDSPVFVTAAPGAPNLLFVVEQAGRIRVLRNGHAVGRPFLDMRGRVKSGGEQGLLSVAFDPNYATNRRFYVYFTNHDCSGGCNVEVDGYRRRAGSATRANRRSHHKVIEVNHHEAANHNGGQLEIGPDGRLYISIGDGGTQGDPSPPPGGDAQNKSSLLGKILRVRPRAGGGYTVPADNPYVGKPGRNQIFARGFRNPWRFSFDSTTGDIWVGDVGYGTYEEIDHETLASANGGNFGWHFFEGPKPCGDCGFGQGTDPPPAYRAPVHWYKHSGSGETGNVIVGGYVAHDPTLPAALDGDYVYTDSGAGDLRVYDPGTNSEFDLGPSVSAPSSFGVDAAGHLYVASLGDDQVYRLVAP